MRNRAFGSVRQFFIQHTFRALPLAANYLDPPDYRLLKPLSFSERS